MYVMMGEIRKVKTKKDLSDHPHVIFPVNESSDWVSYVYFKYRVFILI